MTRSPIRPSSTPAPTDTMWPQQSAPCMRGKDNAIPVQLTSSSSDGSNPEEPPSEVPLLTPLEYQPIRVLMSVLLIAAAATFMRTSPVPGCGTGRSVLNCSLSKPPCPVSTTPDMVIGMRVEGDISRPLCSCLLSLSG